MFGYYISLFINTDNFSFQVKLSTNNGNFSLQEKLSTNTDNFSLQMKLSSFNNFKFLRKTIPLKILTTMPFSENYIKNKNCYSIIPLRLFNNFVSIVT